MAWARYHPRCAAWHCQRDLSRQHKHTATVLVVACIVALASLCSDAYVLPPTGGTQAQQTGLEIVGDPDCRAAAQLTYAGAHVCNHSVVVDVTFPTPVSGLRSDDFLVHAGGNAVATSAVLSGAGDTYQLQITLAPRLWTQGTEAHVAAAAACPVGMCPAGYTLSPDHMWCAKVIAEPRSWEQQNAACGPHTLASLTSTQHGDFIRDLLDKHDAGAGTFATTWYVAKLELGHRAWPLTACTRVLSLQGGHARHSVSDKLRVRGRPRGDSEPPVGSHWRRGALWGCEPEYVCS